MIVSKGFLHLVGDSLCGCWVYGRWLCGGCCGVRLRLGRVRKGLLLLWGVLLLLLLLLWLLLLGVLLWLLLLPMLPVPQLPLQLTQQTQARCSCACACCGY